MPLKHKISFFVLLVVTFQICAINLFAQVQQEWAMRYFGANAYSIALDSAGNIFVAGDYPPGVWLTLKYNSSGQLQWSRLWSGQNASQPKKIGCDRQGNVYLAGSDGTYVLLKYNTNGVEQWVRRYLVAGGVTDMVIDRNDNPIITGGIFNSITLNDIATIKYKPNGDSVWVRILHTGGSNREYGPAMGINPVGEIALAGLVFVPNASAYLTAKYDSNGALQWWRTYYNSNDSSNQAFDVDIDNIGNVYVTGTRNYIGWLTIKYDAGGKERWIRTYNGQLYDPYIPSNVKISNDGNVYVAGLDFPGNDVNLTLIKYDSNGTQKWLNYFKGPNNASIGTYVNDMVIDSIGNTYYTGSYDIDSQEINYGLYTLKLKPDGNNVWVQYYNGPGMKDIGKGIAIDKLGNVYICGNTSDTIGSQSGLIVIKYSQPLGIEPVSGEIPRHFQLFQNYPNPFNASTFIKFQIPQKTKVTIKIYDILGRLISILINETLGAGIYKARWDAASYPSGLYIYQIITDEFSEAKKLVLLK